MPQPFDAEKIKVLKEITSEYEHLDSLASSFVESLQTSLDKLIESKSQELDLNMEVLSCSEQILQSLREQGKTRTKAYRDNQLIVLQQEALTELMAMEINSLRQKQGIQNTIKHGISEIFKSFQDTNSAAGQLFSTFKNFTSPLTAIFSLLKLSSERFSALDRGAEKFRIETGLLRDQTKQIENNIREISREMQLFGVDIEESYISATKLTDTFGDQFIASNKENLQYVSLMSKNLGVAEESSSEVLRNFMGIGKMSSESSRYMSAQVVSLTKAAGIPFNKVMNDVAKASGETLSLVRGSVVQLIKATVEARRLGTSLEAVSSAASKLLDFQSSIVDEMEASVLLGKDINLQRARQLAYDGDLTSLAREQSDIISKAGKLDFYQQQSIAKALGLSVEQFTQMVAKQQELSELRSQDPNFAKQYEEEMQKISDLTTKNNSSLKTKYEQELKSQQVQATQTQLANQFKTLVTEIADLLVPVFTWIGKGVEMLSKGVRVLQEHRQAFYAISIAAIGLGVVFRGHVLAPFRMGLSLLSEYASKLKSLVFKTPIPSSTPRSAGGFGGSLSRIIKNVKPTQLLAVGVAMVAFAGSVFILSKASKEFGSPEAQAGFKYMAFAAGGMAILTFGLIALGKVIAVSSPFILASIGVMLSLAATIGILSLAAMGFGKAFTMFVDGFERSMKLDLIKLAGGFYALSASMMAFGVSMAAGGLASFLGGGMLLQLAALSALAPRLSIAAESLKTVADSIQLFKDSAVVDGINDVTEAIKKLNEEINEINLNKLNNLASNNKGFQSNPIVGNNSNTAVVSKLDELIKLLQNGAIGVNIDGSKANMLLSKSQKERGAFGAI